MARLVLIDGHAILHRAFHALPNLTTRSGELVNAVYGFATMLFRILDELKPEYIAVAFDTPGPNFRHQEFVGYQAKRPIADQELIGQVERVHELVSAFNIPIFESPGFEADDTIGSLAKLAVKREKSKIDEVIIVTGDKDLTQLVNDRVRLYMPTRGLSEAQVVGEKEVEEKMGVSPKMVVDFKGLVGDQSDNYPGVMGIGPKTAVDLLEKFGSLKGVYKAVEEDNKQISETVKQKLLEGKEGAYLSQKLATILTDVPLKFDLEKCRTVDYDQEKVLAFFKELGFRSLARRVGGGEVGKDKTKKKKDERQQELF